MSLKDTIKSKVRGAIYEEEPEVHPKNVPSVSASYPKDTILGVNSSPALAVEVSTPLTATTTSESYQRLLTKTDFDQTIIGGKLKKYLDPLASLPLDEKMKLQTALVQLKAQDPTITSDGILKVFDSLKSILDAEVLSFHQSVAKATADGVDGRLAKIEEVKKQIMGLQVQLTDMLSAVNQTKNKIEKAKNEFEEAARLRVSELDAQKEHYASFLK